MFLFLPLFQDPFGTTSYAQIGRFNTSGTIHNGVRVPSGVDWLDFLGSTQILNARTGFCFNSGPNMPPVFKGGPMDGIVSIPCGSNLKEYKVRRMMRFLTLSLSTPLLPFIEC
jgi:hypothetical protein